MEIKHNFNIMNPQGNRQNQHQNGNPRLPDARFPPNFVYHAPTSMGDVKSFLMPMPHQYFYGGYPYGGLPCQNAAYFAALGPQWRDVNVMQPSYIKEIGPLPNLYNSQTTRVTMREMKDKSQTEVINLQSDEQEKKTKIDALVPLNNNINKQPQKLIQIIELDQNSVDRNFKLAKLPASNQVTTNAQTVNKIQKIQKIQLKIEKTEHIEIRKKQSTIQYKTKHILKLKKKQHKVYQKIEREDKSSKQRKKKYIEHEKKKIKEEKQIQKLLQKVDKKKIERSEKNQKTLVPQTKKKVEESHTKQIAKYMQSHGEIRHGNEFQSVIPSVIISSGTEFNSWLQEKRKRLLKREVGPLTY